MKANSIQARVILAGMLCLSGDCPVHARIESAAANSPQPSRPIQLPPRNILDAIRAKDLQAVQADMDQQPSKAARAQRAGCLLPAAAETGSVEIVDYLLTAGAVPDAQSSLTGSGPRTALELAASRGHTEACRRLLDAGADRNAPGGFYSSPLLAALGWGQGNDEVVKLLLQRGADPFVEDKRQNSAFKLALRHLRKDLVAAMMASPPAGAYLATNGTAVLNQVLYSGMADVTEDLLKRGVSPNAPPERDLTPLQILALKNDYGGQGGFPIPPERGERLRQSFLAAGARMDVFSATGFKDAGALLALVEEDPASARARDGRGQTLLHWAVMSRSLEMLDFWIQHGAEPAGTTALGRSALHLAAETGQSGLVERLLAVGVSLFARDADCQTPLDLAVAKGHTPAARLLFSAGDSGQSTGRGPSLPLHQAITANNSELFFASLTTTTNLNVPNEFGLSPLLLAARSGHLPFLLALLEAGANPNAADPDGSTSLHTATSGHYVRYHPLPSALRERAMRVPAVQELWPQPAADPSSSAQLQAVLLLLAHGADANRTNRAGISPAQLGLQRAEDIDDESTRTIIKLLRRAGGRPEELDPHGETALHRAARRGDADKLVRLLNTGASPDTRDAKGRTSLHTAVECVYGWTEDAAEWTNTTIGVLLKAGADPNARDPEGQTPLHTLVRAEQDTFAAEVAATLLQNRADPNIRDRKGNTPLHSLFGYRWRFDERHDQVCLRLLAGGADPNARDNEGRTPLHYGALGDGGPSSQFKELPDGYLEAKPNLDATDANGDTPLHLAARTGTSKVYAALREAGARADLKNQAGETPLWLQAVRSGRLGGAGRNDELTDLIFADNGSGIENLLALEPRLIHLTNRFGEPPLRCAARFQRTNVVEVLLRHGATWDVISAVILNRGPKLHELLASDRRQATNALYGTPLLHLAAQAGNADNVRAVLDAGADIHRPDHRGLTAWGVARMATNTAVAELLLQQGARPTIFDAIAVKEASLVMEMLRQNPSLAQLINHAGAPAAHLAVARGLDSALRQMLETGLPPDFATAQGLTLLHVAAVWNRTNAAVLLLQHGARVEPFDHAGLTPLFWAAREDAVEVAHLLLAAGASPKTWTAPVVGESALTERDRFTALHEAVSASRLEMIGLLVRAGGNLNEPNGEGLTAWDLARQSAFRSDEIGRARLARTGPLELVSKDPGFWASAHRSKISREVQSFVELLGGMPGQGNKRGGSQMGRRVAEPAPHR